MASSAACSGASHHPSRADAAKPLKSHRAPNWHAECNALRIPPEWFAAASERTFPMSITSKFGANVVSVIGALLVGAVMLSAAVPVLPVA